MKNLFTWALVSALAVTPGFALQPAQAGQQQQKPQQQPQQGQQQPAQPAQKPPRVLGQPQTREEYDAYVALAQSATIDPAKLAEVMKGGITEERARILFEGAPLEPSLLAELKRPMPETRARTLLENMQRAKLAEDFLKKYPDSGLSPYVHQIAATTYQQLNNYEKLVEHGEATLKELPDNAVILTFLASGYAQRGKSDLALQRSDKAITAINALQPPPNVNAAEFAKGKNDLLAMAYGSKGIAYLVQAQEARLKKATEPKKEEPANPANPGNPANGKKDESDPNLVSAITNLKKAIELNPKDDLAYFEMGIAYTLKNDAENAIDAYAKAVAIGGFVTDLAKDKLKAVLEAVLRLTQADEEQKAQKENRKPETVEQRVAKRMEEAVLKAKSALNPPPAAAPPPPATAKPPSN